MVVYRWCPLSVEEGCLKVLSVKSSLGGIKINKMCRSDSNPIQIVMPTNFRRLRVNLWKDIIRYYSSVQW